MRVLALLPYAWDTVPGQRFRIEQWYPRLTARGVEIRAEPLITADEQRLLYSSAPSYRKALMLGGSLIRRTIQLLRGVSRYDAVWLYRAALLVGPPVLERVLAASGVPLILEFDDAIYLTDTADSNRRWAGFKFSASKTAQLCRMSDHVVVGNEYLARYARRFNPRVSVVPTTIDTDVYRPCESYTDSKPLVIGWSGSRTTVAHLRTLDPVLRRVAARVPVRLQVVGTPEYRLDGVETVAREWSAGTEVADLGRFDVGVMPLPDQEWAYGKCGLKALQYMGLAIPTLASPVGVNGEIITDGVNGFLPRTEDEWVERLLALAADVRLRERLGRAGRRTVEDRYSADVGAALVMDVLHAVRRPLEPSRVAGGSARRVG